MFKNLCVYACYVLNITDILNSHNKFSMYFSNKKIPTSEQRLKTLESISNKGVLLMKKKIVIY